MMTTDKQFDVLLQDIFYGSATRLGPASLHMLTKELRRCALLFSQLEVKGTAERGQEMLIRTLENSASMLEASDSGDLIEFLKACKQSNYSTKDVDYAVQSVFGS